MSTVRFTGLRETVRSLERFGAEVQDLRNTFNKAGQVVVNEALTIVPTLSGALANSIRASKTKNKAEVRAGSAAIPYAGVIHYGGYNNITGVPFLTTAVENKQGEALALVETDLNRLIQSLGLN